MPELYIGFGLRYVHYVLMGSFANYKFSSRWRLLMIGDSNRVLIVVEDEVKEEQVVASSLKSHIWVRNFATSRGFFGTTRRF